MISLLPNYFKDHFEVLAFSVSKLLTDLQDLEQFGSRARTADFKIYVQLSCLILQRLIKKSIDRLDLVNNHAD